MPRKAVALLVLLAACGGEPRDHSRPDPPTDVTGLITEVQRTDGEVTSFSLDVDGDTYEVTIDPDRDYGFDLNHLDEHVAQRDPVRVRLDPRQDVVYAVSIDDA